MPRTPDPRRSAVLVVECQNGVLGPQSLLPALAADAAPMLARLAGLLGAARRAGIRVVHGTFETFAGAVDMGTTPLLRSMAATVADWGPGSSASRVLDELLSDGDLVLPRSTGLTPTSGTELLPLLRQLGVDQLVLTGVSLNVALPLAAGQAADAGFEVFVPRDAVHGTPVAYAELVLAHTVSMIARVTTVHELVAAWSASQLTEPR